MEIAYWGIIIIPLLVFGAAIMIVYLHKYSERTPRIPKGRRKKKRRPVKVYWEDENF